MTEPNRLNDNMNSLNWKPLMNMNGNVTNARWTGRLTATVGAVLLTAVAGCSDSPVQPAATQVPATIQMQTPVTSFHSLEQFRGPELLVLDRRGEVVENPPLVWSLDAEGVVEMTEPGVFRSISNGEVVLTVRVDHTHPSVRDAGYASGVVEHSHRLVVDQRPAALSFAAGDRGDGESFHVAWLGRELDISAHLVDANGFPIQGNATEIRWELGNSNILNWTEDGRIVAVDSGETTIQARAGNWSTTLPVTVDAELHLNWCVDYQVPRPDAPANGLQACGPTDLTFAHEEDA